MSIVIEVERPAHHPAFFRNDKHVYRDHLPACDIAPADPDTRYTSVTTLTNRAWPSVFKKNAFLPDGTKYTTDMDVVRAWNHLERVGGIDVTDADQARAFIRSADDESDRAKQRGQDVHDVFEALVNGTPVPPLVPEYVDAIKAALAALGPMANPLTERVCFNRATGIAGAFDLAFVIPDDGQWELDDFKSRAPNAILEPRVTEIAQLGGYSTAEYYIDSLDGVAFRVPMPEFSALSLVLVSPTEYAVVPVDVHHAQVAWRNLLDCDAVRLFGQQQARKARGRYTVFSVGVADARPDVPAPTEPPSDRDAILARLHALDDARRALVKLRWSWPVAAKDLSDADLPALVALLDDVARDTGAGFTASEVPVTEKPEPSIEVKVERPTWQPPPDGDEVDKATIGAIRATVDAASEEVRRWIQLRVGQAKAAHRPITGTHARWFEQARALLAAGTVVLETWGGDDELLRCVLAAAMGDEAAMQPGFTLGAIFGTLTIAEAQAVTLACQQCTHDPQRAPVAYLADGSAVLAA